MADHINRDTFYHACIEAGHNIPVTWKGRRLNSLRLTTILVNLNEPPPNLLPSIKPPGRVRGKPA